MTETKIVTKEVTLCLPHKLVDALAEIYPDISMSEQIRKTLLQAELYPDVDLSTLSVPYSEGKRKNYYLPMANFKEYEKEASKRGQSVSGYLLNLMGNVLGGEGYLDLPLRWKRPLEPFEVTNSAQIPRFEFSFPLIEEMNRHDFYRPFNVEVISQIILDYVQDGLSGEDVDISVEGFYFHQRHKQKKESMKVRVSPVINDILYQVARRMGTTRMMVLTQALIYHFNRS
tara:strand:+ start:133 stop:819 length:687 start_codon:yes stop_codon:yes gene_type:complete